MNISTGLRRIATATIGAAAVSALSVPAAQAHLDTPVPGIQCPVGPVGPTATTADIVDSVIARKLALSRARHAATNSQRPTGNRIDTSDGLFDDIAYLIDTRKAAYARFRIEHARELSAN